MERDLNSTRMLMQESLRLTRKGNRYPDSFTDEAHRAMREASLVLQAASTDILTAVIKRNMDRPHELAEAIILGLI